VYKPFENEGIAIHGDAVAGVKKMARAQEVLEQVDQLKSQMVNNRWELADLLEEIHDHDYHRERGFNDFDDYIDQGNFDVGSREARYLIKINRNSKKLEIPRDDLKKVAISKLKEVFTLDPETQSDHIKRLVSAAQEQTLDAVRDEVRSVRGLDPADEFTWRNFRVTRASATEVIDPAIERARREWGDTIDGEGNPKDISEGQAITAICADFNASPDLMKHESEQAVLAEEGPVEA
jgi:hypothetical protein